MRNMQIAVFVDTDGMIASPYGEGGVALFSQTADGWQRQTDIAFAITPDMSLSDVKLAVQDLVSALGGCRVFVASETRGLLYSLLEDEHGFHGWRSNGLALPGLDALAALENARVVADTQAAEAAACQPASRGGCSAGCGSRVRAVAAEATCIPNLAEPVGDGWRIDLAGALEKYPSLNSRDILLPLLDVQNFTSLEVLCDHLPRWFSQELADLRLRADIHERNAGGLRVEVLPIF